MPATPSPAGSACTSAAASRAISAAGGGAHIEGGRASAEASTAATVGAAAGATTCGLRSTNGAGEATATGESIMGESIGDGLLGESGPRSDRGDNAIGAEARFTDDVKVSGPTYGCSRRHAPPPWELVPLGGGVSEAGIGESESSCCGDSWPAGATGCPP